VALELGEQRRAHEGRPQFRLILDELQMEVGRVSAMLPLQTVQALRRLNLPPPVAFDPVAIDLARPLVVRRAQHDIADTDAAQFGQIIPAARYGTDLLVNGIRVPTVDRMGSAMVPVSRLRSPLQAPVPAQAHVPDLLPPRLLALEAPRANGQTLATQKAMHKAAGVERIFSEKVSGVAAKPPEGRSMCSTSWRPATCWL